MLTLLIRTSLSDSYLPADEKKTPDSSYLPADEKKAPDRWQKMRAGHPVTALHPTLACDQDCSISRSHCPTAHEYKYSRLVRMQTSVKEGANVETGTAKCLRQQRWLVRMQTAVKEGANVETGTRKVSATTELVRHSDAGPGARAARPHTHLRTPRGLASSLHTPISNSERFQTLFFSRPVIQMK